MADDASDATIVYGDSPPVRATTHTGHASPDDIVAIAKQIWACVTESGVAKSDDAGNDALLSTLQNRFREFNASFPLVMRWMVQMRQFKVAALHKYLIKHGTADLSSRENFLDLQAEYLVLLYREAHPRADQSFVRRYRASIIAQLRKEDAEFMDMNKTVEEEIKARQAEVDTARRDELYAFLLAARVKKEQEAALGTGAPP
jgi:hypothetical protein